MAGEQARHHRCAMQISDGNIAGRRLNFGRRHIESRNISVARMA
jgi:hypothetical protein